MPDVNKNRMHLKKITGLLLGLSFFALFFHLIDFSWKDSINLILKNGLLILSCLLVFTALLYYISALKLKYIIIDTTSVHNSLTIGRLFYYTSLGYYLSLLVPQAVVDIGVKGFFLKTSHNVSFKHGAFSVLLDQFFNAIIGILFLVPAILLLTGIFDLKEILIISLFEIGIFVIIFWYYNQVILSLFSKMYFRVLKLLQKLPFYKNKGDKVTRIYAEDFAIRSHTARKLMLWTFVRHLTVVFRLFIIAFILDLQIDFFTLFSCSTLMLYVGIISFIPGQIGIGELGWYGLLSLRGISEPQIFTFIISMRIFSNLAILIIGFLSWIVFDLFSFRVGKNPFQTFTPEQIHLNEKSNL